MRNSALLFLAPLLLALTGACSKASSGMTASGAAYPESEMAYPAEAPEYYGDDEYELDGANIEEERSRMAPAAPGGGAKFKKKADKVSRTLASPAPAPDVSGEPAPEPAIAEPDDQPDDHGRQIVYTANMQIGVYNVKKAMEIAEALPGRLGGWVHNRQEGFITMKIPAEHLRRAMDELSRLGNVVSRELQATDVTAEYVDLDTRIKVLRETQTQLLALLKRAKSVEEALNVRRALDDVTMQLELALGRMRQLQSQISFSTLTVTLSEQGPHVDTPSSNDPFPWVDQLGVEATEWR